MENRKKAVEQALLDTRENKQLAAENYMEDGDKQRTKRMEKTLDIDKEAQKLEVRCSSAQQGRLYMWNRHGRHD